MWKVVDGNISLDPSYVKKESEWPNDPSEHVKTETGAGAGLAADIKEENGLIRSSETYLLPYMEVTVKIEDEGKACNENQMPCNTEMKSPRLTGDHGCSTIVGSNENMKTDLELIVFRDCFVRLERMRLYKKIYTCKTCQKKMNSKQSLKSHLLCHTEQESNLQIKTMKKMTEERLETKLCKTCGMARVTNSLKTKENSCTCKKKNIAKRNLSNESKNIVEKPFKCNYCGKCFKSNFLLSNHKRIHTGERPYSCPICNKPFSELSNLTRHKRSHTGERPYCCNICNKQFTLKTNLDKHIRIHTQEKPFTCDFCSKQFVHSSDLKKHEQVHTGEKPFACDVCQIRFRRKYLLVNHLTIHSKKLD